MKSRRLVMYDKIPFSSKIKKKWKAEDRKVSQFPGSLCVCLESQDQKPSEFMVEKLQHLIHPARYFNKPK